MIQESRCSLAGYLCVKIFHKPAVKVLIGAIVSFPGFPGERSASKVTQMVVGLRFSVPRWLLAGGCPQFLAMWPSLGAAHSMAAGFH